MQKRIGIEVEQRNSRMLFCHQLQRLDFDSPEELVFALPFLQRGCIDGLHRHVRSQMLVEIRRIGYYRDAGEDALALTKKGQNGESGLEMNLNVLTEDQIEKLHVAR